MQKIVQSIFLCVWLVALSGVCSAQITEPPVGNKSRDQYIAMLIDSLSIAEKRHDAVNAIRYAAVLTTQLQFISNEQAAPYLQLALRYAKLHPDPKWYADVCNRAGMLMLNYTQDQASLTKLNITSVQMYDSSLYWHRQAVQKALTIGRHGTAGWGYRGLLNTALGHYNKSIRDSIPYYYNYAIAMAAITHDSELVTYSNTAYGAYLTQRGEQNSVKSTVNEIASQEFSKSDNVASLIDNLAKAEAAKDTAAIIEHAFNLTNSLSRALMYDRADSYSKLALSYATSYSDSTLLAYAYLQKGTLMDGLNKQDSARYYYLQTIKTGNKSSPVGWAYYQLLLRMIKDSLANVNKDSIEYYHNMALAIGNQMKNTNLIISCALSNHRYLAKSGNLEKAGGILKSLWLQEHLMRPSAKESFYSSVHDYLAAINHLDTLTTMKKLILEQHDIQTAATHKEQLYAKDQQYEVSKTKNILEATTNKLDTTNKALIASVIALLLFLFLITYLFLLFRKNRKLSHRNELLLKEQNHRVKNNLQMISSLLSLQSQRLLSSDAKEALEESKSRINSVALLHRMLYQGETVGNIEATGYIKSLTEEIQYSAGRKIRMELTLPEKLELKIEKMTSLGLIINELITNSIKHVDNSIELYVCLSILITDGNIHLSYEDNVTGVTPETWLSSDSFGNQLIQIQSKQLRGEFRVSGTNGFRYDLKIAS